MIFANGKVTEIALFFFSPFTEAIRASSLLPLVIVGEFCNFPFGKRFEVMDVT